MPPHDSPYILILCHPLTGHVTPLLGVAGILLQRGWEVGFLGPTRHRPRIESVGVEFFQLQGLADVDDRELSNGGCVLSPERDADDDVLLSPHMRRVLADTRAQCYDTIPDQWASIRHTLTVLHARSPARQNIVVCEAFVHGILPLKLGAALPSGVSVPRTVCVSVTPPMIRTRLQPPFGPGLPPFEPSSPARAARLWERWVAGAGGEMGRYLDERIVEAGGLRGTEVPFLTGANYMCHEAVLQVGLPGLEYPRDDWPAGFRFVGLVPPSGTGSGVGVYGMHADRLPWWDEFMANARLSRDDPGRKKVIVVTQGTVEVDAMELIVPTMQAVADLKRVCLVAILGVKDGTLPAGSPPVPPNARVVDYLPYGALLPHADLWVHNAGYGAVTQGIAAGVPMVVAGEGQDKAENCRRVGWSGVGVDLGTSCPTVEQVRGAVVEVLREGSRYRERIEAMKKDAEGWDFGDMVEEEIEKLVER